MKVTHVLGCGPVPEDVAEVLCGPSNLAATEDRVVLGSTMAEALVVRRLCMVTVEAIPFKKKEENRQAEGRRAVAAIRSGRPQRGRGL